MNSVEEQLIIPSLPESLSFVENFVENLCLQYKIDDSLFGNILIALTEAVNNAIIHGNKNNPDKNVVITHTVSTAPKTLTIKVTDEGNGFDYLNIPDPTAPENLETIGGRGVFLIKQLSDLVIFSDKGETIELQFRI